MTVPAQDRALLTETSIAPFGEASLLGGPIKLAAAGGPFFAIDVTTLSTCCAFSVTKKRKAAGGNKKGTEEFDKGRRGWRRGKGVLIFVLKSR